VPDIPLDKTTEKSPDPAQQKQTGLEMCAIGPATLVDYSGVFFGGGTPTTAMRMFSVLLFKS
jgi:hypothetical protein